MHSNSYPATLSRIVRKYKVAPRILDSSPLTGKTETDCYHGTTRNAAELILADGFRPSFGLLGTGCYFDLHSPLSAFKRARERGPEGKGLVFQVEICLGRVVDLDVPDVQRRFKAFQRGCNRAVAPWSREFERGHHSDLFVAAVEAIEEDRVDCVRRTFERTGLCVIAVRNPERIRILETNLI